MLSYSEQFIEYIEYTSNAFFKIVQHNEAISHDFERKQKQEILNA